MGFHGVDGLGLAGGAGVETVVAGSGIAVDSTDPANPVVSATHTGANGELIAYLAYDPNPAVGPILLSNTPPLVKMQGSHLFITFTAPATGKVEVFLEALWAEGTKDAWWGLVDNALTEFGIAYTGFGVQTPIRRRVSIPVTSLTPGTSYTLYWACMVTSGSTASLWYGDSGIGNTPARYGPAIMEVRGLA